MPCLLLAGLLSPDLGWYPGEVAPPAGCCGANVPGLDMKLAAHVIGCVATGVLLAWLLFYLTLAFTDGENFPQ